VIFKEVIKKKRDGGKLTREEIFFAVNSYTQGQTPDYQMAAFLMAVFLRGMDWEETLNLTEAMLKSGKEITLALPPPLVDKHSTGGIGDKVSIVLAPVLAEMGFRAPLLAGRALGFTGGTVDKLESTGMRVELSPEEIEEVVRRFGFSISAQTKEIAPADRKIYALRDATATVESIPLIVSSILSKKLAVNADAIVFDVKVGSGAFVKETAKAEELAKGLVEVSKLYGKRAGALITDMNQPLGIYAGNALEVRECYDALKGEVAPDLLEVTASLAGALYFLTERGSFKEGKRLAEEVIKRGRALKRFTEWVEFLGGNPYPEVKAKRAEVRAPKEGFVAGIDGESLGWLLIEMGGGRRRAEDEIDYSVGFAFHKKVGDFVREGEVVGEVYFNSGKEEELVKKFLSAYAFSKERVERPKLVKKCLPKGTCN